jgi:hypothetical protein
VLFFCWFIRSDSFDLPFSLHSQWATRQAAVQVRVAEVIADTLGRKAKPARVGLTTSWWMEIGSRTMVETTGRHEIDPMNTDTNAGQRVTAVTPAKECISSHVLSSNLTLIK